MTDINGALPARLQQIVAEFQMAEGREKLELLLEYAESLPALPEWLKDRRDSMEPVPECMTPVFVYAERQNGRLRWHFDVPPESPTVRGYAALMAEGLNDASPEEVLSVPGDFFYAMGLQQVISPQRLNGLSAILAHMKRLATEALQAAAA
ncbi:MAG: SufE family protein [Caldilineales bacterium]|nr:SufE family protein [Caldilineales bacterium]MDW8316448.1 SufE family protein [Anaerolineae bacterium]